MVPFPCRQSDQRGLVPEMSCPGRTSPSFPASGHRTRSSTRLRDYRPPQPLSTARRPLAALRLLSEGYSDIQLKTRDYVLSGESLNLPTPRRGRRPRSGPQGDPAGRVDQRRSPAAQAAARSLPSQPPTRARGIPNPKSVAPCKVCPVLCSERSEQKRRESGLASHPDAASSPGRS